MNYFIKLNVQKSHLKSLLVPQVFVRPALTKTTQLQNTFQQAIEWQPSLSGLGPYPPSHPRLVPKKPLNSTATWTHTNWSSYSFEVSDSESSCLGGRGCYEDSCLFKIVKMDFDEYEYLEKTVENPEHRESKEAVNGGETVLKSEDKDRRRRSRHRSDMIGNDANHRLKRTKSGDESRDRDKERGPSVHRSSSRDRERSDRDGHRSSREHRHRSSREHRHKDHEGVREERNGKERGRDIDKDTEKDRDRVRRERDRERGRERDRDTEREQEHSYRSRSRSERHGDEQDREKSPDRNIERDREKEVRERGRESRGPKLLDKYSFVLPRVEEQSPLERPWGQCWVHVTLSQLLCTAFFNFVNLQLMDRWGFCGQLGWWWGVFGVMMDFNGGGNNGFRGGFGVFQVFVAVGKERGVVSQQLWWVYCWPVLTRWTVVVGSPFSSIEVGGCGVHVKKCMLTPDGGELAGDDYLEPVKSLHCKTGVSMWEVFSGVVMSCYDFRYPPNIINADDGVTAFALQKLCFLRSLLLQMFGDIVIFEELPDFLLQPLHLWQFFPQSHSLFFDHLAKSFNFPFALIVLS
ncbi:unnamed protein product [Ilex paraguariensis]|uniref:Uncharacterized protein n=1 Tax=Ilex paraguariensis TaxID=185542 RepID=A0ABC8RU66_9AQUA